VKTDSPFDLPVWMNEPRKVCPHKPVQLYSTLQLDLFSPPRGLELGRWGELEECKYPLQKLILSCQYWNEKGEGSDTPLPPAQNLNLRIYTVKNYWYNWKNLYLTDYLRQFWFINAKKVVKNIKIRNCRIFYSIVIHIVFIRYFYQCSGPYFNSS